MIGVGGVLFFFCGLCVTKGKFNGGDIDITDERSGIGMLKIRCGCAVPIHDGDGIGGGRVTVTPVDAYLNALATSTSSV